MTYFSENGLWKGLNKLKIKYIEDFDKGSSILWRSQGGFGLNLYKSLSKNAIANFSLQTLSRYWFNSISVELSKWRRIE